jgi:tetratricopeptide (TPR) repeat protein
MSRSISFGTSLLLLSLAGHVLTAAVAASAEDWPVSRKEAEEEASRLWEEGRYDEAITAAAPWGNLLQDHVLLRIHEAARDEQRDEATRQLELFFRFYPFGLLRNLDTKLLRTAALAYSKHRGASADAPADSAEGREAAAAELFGRLEDSYWAPGDRKAALELVDQIVEAHADTPYCLVAVLYGLPLCFDRSGRYLAPNYTEYLARMKALGAPPRAQILMLASQANFHASSPSMALQAIPAYESIAELTDITQEARYCLLRCGEMAFLAGQPLVGFPPFDHKAMNLSRALYRRFLAEYPSVRESGKARLGIMRTYLDAGQRHEALAELWHMEPAPPLDADNSEAIVAVSDAFFDAHDYLHSVALLPMAIERGAKGPLMPHAYLRLAEAHEKLGDESAMIAAYEKAACVSRTDRPAILRDETYAHSAAVKRLAEYYMEKRQWGQALSWWTAWQPSSDCGAGLWGQQDQRNRNIILCHLRLGNRAEAERMALEAGRWGLIVPLNAD